MLKRSRVTGRTSGVSFSKWCYNSTYVFCRYMVRCHMATWWRWKKKNRVRKKRGVARKKEWIQPGLMVTGHANSLSLIGRKRGKRRRRWRWKGTDSHVMQTYKISVWWWMRGRRLLPSRWWIEGNFVNQVNHQNCCYLNTCTGCPMATVQRHHTISGDLRHLVKKKKKNKERSSVVYTDVRRPVLSYIAVPCEASWKHFFFMWRRFLPLCRGLAGQSLFHLSLSLPVQLSEIATTVSSFSGENEKGERS